MRNMLPLALIIGAIAGLLAGVFMNVFNVPVMEWAIELESAQAGSGAEACRISTLPWDLLALSGLASLLGLAVLGVIYGAVFTGMFHVVRQGVAGLEYMGMVPDCRIPVLLVHFLAHPAQISP